MPLTDAQVRNAKAGAKPYKLADGRGLHLYISKAGGKLWRMRFRFAGKERTLSLGRYPGVGLADARTARDQARQALAEGKDPSALKKQKRLGPPVDQTFEAIAREWHRLQKSVWSPVHSDDVLTSLEADVFPKIAGRSIQELGPTDILDLVRAIEARGAFETARRVRQRISAVFVYGISTGRADSDPAAIIAGAMAPALKTRQPAITDLKRAREMLQVIEATPASPVTKLAMRLLALTALRPGALVASPWSEFDAIDAKAPLWIIPAARMKLRRAQKADEGRDFLVPLSLQAVDAIAVLRRLTGRTPFLFPNARHAHRPMSENALGYLLNRAGFNGRHVPHGWRSTFSTVMNERFRHDRPIIDLMLAHVPKDKVESVYNRAAYLDRRRELAQEWADLILDGMCSAADLLAGPRRTHYPDELRRAIG